jgi:hypothetical protein
VICPRVTSVADAVAFGRAWFNNSSLPTVSMSVPTALKKKNGLRHFCCNPLILLAEWTGLEPATPGVTGRYSNQLNYHSMRLMGPLKVLCAPSKTDHKATDLPDCQQHPRWVCFGVP